MEGDSDGRSEPVSTENDAGYATHASTGLPKLARGGEEEACQLSMTSRPLQVLHVLQLQ